LSKNKKILFTKHTPFNEISVTLKGDIITLYSPDGYKQSEMNSKYPLHPTLEYHRHLMMCLAFRPSPSKVLALGLGGGVVPNVLDYTLRSTEIEAVEIDEAIVDVAKQYFGLKPSANFRIIIEDAFVYIYETQKCYDVIILDTYFGNELPVTVKNELFFSQCARRITEKGILAVNLMTGNREKLEINIALLKQFFDCIWFLPGITRSNLIAFCSKSQISISTIAKNAALLHDILPFPLPAEKLAAHMEIH
jgi:spermidine synthase